MLVTDDGMLMSVRFLQLRNAELPMLVTDDGMVAMALFFGYAYNMFLSLSNKIPSAELKQGLSDDTRHVSIIG